MSRFFIISFWVLILRTCYLAAQPNADSLLHYEWLYYNCADDNRQQEILLRKIKLYTQSQCTGRELLREIQRVRPAYIVNKEERQNFLWNAALLYYLNQDDERCRQYIDRYKLLRGDATTEAMLLEVLANRHHDTLKVNSLLKELEKRDSLFAGLRLLKELDFYERKRLGLYLFSSAIIPGSGTAMNGEPLRGALSLALSAASVFGVVKLVQYGLYINSAFTGMGVTLKFYTGNIRLTEKAFERKENRQKHRLAKSCKVSLEKVLEKYPLILKPI